MAQQTFISAVFQQLWNSLYLVLHIINKDISQADVLPVSVAIVVSYVLFYIAFKYFIIKRFVEDEGSQTKFSAALAIPFVVLGTYLGFIPAIAMFFGAMWIFFSVFLVAILWLAVWGMFRKNLSTFRKEMYETEGAENEAYKSYSEQTKGLGDARKIVEEEQHEINRLDQINKDLENKNSLLAQDIERTVNIRKALLYLLKLLPETSSQLSRRDPHLMEPYRERLQAIATRLASTNAGVKVLMEKFKTYVKKEINETDIHDKKKLLQGIESKEEHELAAAESDLKKELADMEKLLADVKKDAELRTKHESRISSEIAGVRDELSAYDNARKKIIAFNNRRDKILKDIDKALEDDKDLSEKYLGHEDNLYRLLESNLDKIRDDLDSLIHTLTDMEQVDKNRAHIKNLIKLINEVYKETQRANEWAMKYQQRTVAHDRVVKEDLGKLSLDNKSYIELYNRMLALATATRSRVQEIRSEMESVKADVKKEKAQDLGGKGARQGLKAHNLDWTPVAGHLRNVLTGKATQTDKDEIKRYLKRTGYLKLGRDVNYMDPVTKEVRGARIKNVLNHPGLFRAVYKNLIFPRDTSKWREVPKNER